MEEQKGIEAKLDGRKISGECGDEKSSSPSKKR
jgi:hypothetical protein